MKGPTQLGQSIATLTIFIGTLLNYCTLNMMFWFFMWKSCSLKVTFPSNPIHRFPPTLCNNSSDMWFYTSVIIDVVVAIGVYL